MGFRSTFVTEDLGGEIPKGFAEKYKEWCHMYISHDGKCFLPISSKVEVKTYGQSAIEIIEDLQKALKELAEDETSILCKRIDLIGLHECGGITKVEIYKDRAVYLEPTGGKITDGVQHDDCYGCSDSSNLIN